MKSLFLRLESLFKCLLDVFFPKTCPVCGQVLLNDAELCDDCVSKLVRTSQALQRDNGTEVLFVHSPHFSWGGCWLHYKKGTYLQEMIHQAKFGNGNPLLLYYLGKLAAQEWKDTGFFDGVDLIVPIPLHDKRLRERGFNQCEYIARGLCEVLEVPMDTEHLIRVRNTKQQSKSNFEERQQGVKNSFRVLYPEEWYGKTIMLVDDIITSGSTMLAAMEAMKDVYNCHVVIFAIAKAI